MSKKVKVGYKVLDCSGKILTSSAQSRSLGGIRYYLNQRNVPKKNCGPLMVFTNLNAAIYYVDTLMILPARIYECQYSPSKIRKTFDAYNTMTEAKLIECSGTDLIDFAEWVELGRRLA